MISVDRKRLQANFERLLIADGVSKKEDETILVVKRILANIPVDIIENASLSKTRKNLYIRLPKRGDTDSPPILLSAHMDTVEPTTNIKFQCINDLYSTDGTTILGSDDKAGIVAILECLLAIHESEFPHPTIEVAFTVEEEIGLEGAKDFDTTLIQSKRGIVIDADGEPGIVMFAGPSQILFEVTIKGKAAHAGMAPEEGKSAILFASQCIARIPFGRIDAETTTNIGRIQGGRATNIVAEDCFLNGEIRSHNPVKLDIIKNQMKSIFENGNEFGYQVHFQDRFAYKSFSLSKDRPILTQVSQAILDCGLTPQYKVCGGGCDANIFNETIPSMECINLACGMTDVHTHKESVLFTDIERVTEILLAICSR
ncbi:MAG: M20/M25/M40 family metallo-hydrolase [Caldisericia bacterium]|nr:M20/M25/M40 family metallo-hydrolase [Caldisericia bacterium]